MANINAWLSYTGGKKNGDMIFIICKTSKCPNFAFT